jgi:hypothetical protein
MFILISCACGKQLRVKDDLAGKRVKCPRCAAVVAVSLPARARPEPPRAAQDAAARAARPATAVANQRHQASPTFWAKPHALGGMVFALSAEGILTADINDEDDFTRARQALEHGAPVEEVLEKPDKAIPYEHVRKVESNLHHRFVDVTWQGPDNKATTETNLLLPDKDARDQTMDSLQHRLRWKRQIIQHNRLQAAWPPVVIIGFFGFVTFCMVMAARHPEGDSGGTKFVRTNWLGAIFVWVFNIFGPVGVALIGAPFVPAGVVWLVMRMMRPPIMLTLTPQKRRE